MFIYTCVSSNSVIAFVLYAQFKKFAQTHAYTCTYIQCICKKSCAYIHVHSSDMCSFLPANMYIYTCSCVYKYVYVCIHVYMHICTYMYRHIYV